MTGNPEHTSTAAPPDPRISALSHIRRPLSSGGKVVVLDTGAVINAEGSAMLQALHSRSIGGIDAHLVKLAQKGAAAFMDNWYIGYGDKSIGDCGTVTLFVEGISMLAAKAVQDFQLYNGQESSTRYIDFSKQPLINPAGTQAGETLLESMRAFHLEGLEAIHKTLVATHPWDPALEPDEKKWEKARKARTFDIMRSFLPAGAMTNLAWHGTIRAIADHLSRLRNHPLPEVQEIAHAAHEALDEHVPHSFKQKRYEATEQYSAARMREYYYNPSTTAPEVTLLGDTIDRHLLLQYREALQTRPVKTEPPKYLAECGTMQFSFLLDFGSFRDLQRHRSITQRMPLLTSRFGFEPWYLTQMDTSLRTHAERFLSEYESGVRALNLPPELAQYYHPMGYRVPNRITGDLPALIWVVELRSGISVHPTLRTVAQDIAGKMQNALQYSGLVLHIDRAPDQFNFKRGSHDIVEKSPAHA